MKSAGILAAAVLGLVGCASSVMGRTGPAVTRAAVASLPTDSVDAAPRAEPPIVQVREYPHSPTVSIVAWTPDETAYGLRASVRRDGSLIRDHQLYISTYYGAVSSLYSGVNSSYASRARGQGGLVQTVALPERLLLSTGISRDIQSCYAWPKCSPYETRGVRVPDAVLRANRDSLAVRFYGRAGGELTITLYRDLIDSYLEKVDSVSAALRKK